MAAFPADFIVIDTNASRSPRSKPLARRVRMREADAVAICAGSMLHAVGRRYNDTND